jgi:hypothetical protein
MNIHPPTLSYVEEFSRAMRTQQILHSFVVERKAPARFHDEMIRTMLDDVSQRTYNRLGSHVRQGTACNGSKSHKTRVNELDPDSWRIGVDRTCAYLVHFTRLINSKVKKENDNRDLTKGICHVAVENNGLFFPRLPDETQRRRNAIR